MEKLLTTKEAALILGVTPARVRQFVMRGQLPAEKFGRDLSIKRSDLKRLESRRVGRPRKVAA
jgi:excisionase family DNA binding protein